MPPKKQQKLKEVKKKKEALQKANDSQVSEENLS